MKIKVSKNSLLQCLEVVVKAIPSKAMFPMEHNFFFDIKDGKCYAYARNSKLQIKGMFPVESKEETSICIPGNVLMNTLRLLREEDLVFNYNPEKFILTLVAGKKRYKITGVNPKDFNPSTIKDDEPVSFKTQASSLIGHINTVAKIVKWDDMRPEIKGVTIISNNGEIDISGTHEAFYFCVFNTKVKTDKEFGIVMPREVSTALGSLKGSGDVDIVIGEKSMTLNLEGFEFYSALIDAQRPLNLEKYFEIDEEKFLLVDRDELLMATKRLTNYCEHASAMVVSLTGGELKLYSENVGFGMDAEEVLDVKNKNVDDIVLGIDVRYLVSILNNITGGTVKLYMSNPKKPVYIKDADTLYEKWGCAVMLLAPKKQ